MMAKAPKATLTMHVTELTLRDYFAAAALSGSMPFVVQSDEPPADVAAACYILADAMIAERVSSREGA